MYEEFQEELEVAKKWSSLSASAKEVRPLTPESDWMLFSKFCMFTDASELPDGLCPPDQG
jgi:hypothetical protein